nr:hypothetical protein [bacterium]
MRAKVILTLLVVTALGVLTGCSTTGNQGNLPLPAGDSSAQASSFKLDVLPGSYIDGSSAAGYELSIEDFGQDVVVSVKVDDAQNLKALYFNLDYNPEQYRPMTASPTELLGEQGDQLSLTSLKDRGTVVYGQVLANYEWRPGYTGDGIVAQVMFREEATPALPRSVSNVPTDNPSASELLYDETNATAELRWDYGHRGDYNQDGLATINDLTPLGAALGQIVAPASFPRADKLSQVDGNGDGAITVAELTPLGAAINVNSGITGYNVYCTTDDTKIPTDNTTPSDPADRVGQVLMGDKQGNVSTDRVFFTFDLATTPAGAFYWVRPYQNTDGNEGTPSNVAGSGVVAPSLTLQAPPAVGDGSSGTPYEVSPGQSYDLILTDPTDGDVSTSVDTTYTTDDPAHVTFAGNTVTFDAGTTGNFTVTGKYKGINSNVLNFTIGGGGGTGLVISPLDDTAAPWDAVPNVSDANVGTTSDDAYILHDSTFNPDVDTDGVYDLAFPLKVEDDLGADLDETAMTWG